MKPLKKVDIEWSPNFAYAIGLLATDGNLSPDGRHLDLTSNDREQLLNFMKCLGISVKIGSKTSGSVRGSKKCLRIQFGDVNFYRFLLSIGLSANKTKTLTEMKIPSWLFFDFLRGHFDGDGTFYSYWDPRWRSSFMFYTTFVSASRPHIDWLRGEIFKRLRVRGHISKSARGSVYQLRFAKRESLKLLPRLYYNTHVVCLSRKRRKIEGVLHAVGMRM